MHQTNQQRLKELTAPQKDSLNALLHLIPGCSAQSTLQILHVYYFGIMVTLLYFYDEPVTAVQER
jgi:hypothetical protein